VSPTGCKQTRTSALVIHSRVPVFWPSLRRSGGMEWTWETPWGTVSLSTKHRGLTGQHRRILDALFAYALDTHRLDTGAMVLLVDPYRVDQATNGGGTTWLRSLLEDLKHADVIIQERNGTRWCGSIVSEWKEAKATRQLPGGALIGERQLWAITISAAWMHAFDNSLVVQYRELLPILHGLRCGAAYALALMVLTHRECSMQLADALRHVMAIRLDMTDRARRKVIGEVMKEAGQLSKLGIEVQGGIVRYHQHPSVRFSRSTSAGSEPVSPGPEPTSPKVEPISLGREPISPGSQEYSRYSREGA